MSGEDYTTVVTSENLSAFNAQASGFPAEEEIQAAEIIEPEVIEPIVEEVEDKPEEAQKPKTGLEKRMHELTSKAKNADAELQKEREARQSLEARLKALEEPKAEPEVVTEIGKPIPSQFTDAFEYAEALADWKVDQKFKAIEQKNAAEKAEQEANKQVESWQARQSAVEIEYPDYAEVVAACDIKVSKEVQAAILESEVGPKVLYHLASNPEEAARISGLPMVTALREIGKLEARFETKKDAPAISAKASKAPPPIAPLKATTVMDNKIDSDGEFHGTPAEYKALRLAGKIK